eukprot:4724539-Pleurochrysis_carterae.AAC.2
MSGRVCVEQYRSAPTSDMYSRWMLASIARSAFVRRAASTLFGRSSEAGACDTWKDEGTPPSGRYVSTSDSMYFRCDRLTKPTSADDALCGAVDIALGDEHAGVGLALLEPPVAESREERALPASSGLRHAVHGPLDAAHARPTVGAVCGVAGWYAATKSLRRIIMRCGAARAASTRREVGRIVARSLVVVHALHLRASLHAEPRFERSVALPLGHPNKPHKPIDYGPAPVCLVIGDLNTLCRGPPLAILDQLLLTRLGIGRGCCCERAVGASSVDAGRVGMTCDKHRSVGSVGRITERLSAEAPAEELSGRSGARGSSVSFAAGAVGA